MNKLYEYIEKHELELKAIKKIVKLELKLLYSDETIKANEFIWPVNSGRYFFHAVVIRLKNRRRSQNGGIIVSI